MKRVLAISLAIVAVVAAGSFGAWSAFRSSTYHVTVLLSSADNLVNGGWVTVNGFKAGKIDKISTKDGKALVDFTLDGNDVPLHDGAKVTIDWKALLGERWVEVQDGARSNAAIPNGGMIPGKQAAPVNLDQVLDALNPATRRHLVSLIGQLNSTMQGHQADAQTTLKDAGPALQSLGQVLSSLGSDGSAIRGLVTQTNGMVGTLAARDSDLRSVIDNLTKVTAAAVTQRRELATALKELPSTLDTAQSTLNELPGVSRTTVPMLKELQPAAAQLPSVARNLEPVLANLTPVVQRLVPTLTAAQALLQYTPGLLDSAKATLPGVSDTTSYLEPALNYLRPYTPELAGWFEEWSGNSSRYDGNGHYVRFYLQEGATSFSDNPGVAPPGTKADPYPAPGANVNQSWNDAWGSGEH